MQCGGDFRPAVPSDYEPGHLVLLRAQTQTERESLFAIGYALAPINQSEQMAMVCRVVKYWRGVVEPPLPSL